MEPVNADDLTYRLVDEGARLLAQHGPDGLSLRRLASAAGTSTMAVYTRFGDKQGLLAAMHREGFRRLGDNLARAAVDAGDAENLLLAIGRAYRRSALESPHLYALMFGALPAGFEPSESDDKAAIATYAPLVDGVRSAVEDGVFAGDAERIALHLWAVAHGMVSLELSGQLSVPPEDAARCYDDALLFAATPFLATSES